MTKRGRQPSVLSSGLLIGLVAFIILGAATLFTLRHRRAATPDTSTSQSDATNSTPPLDLAQNWPIFFSPYKVSLPKPTGFRSCVEGAGVFVYRTGACNSKEDPPFRFRRDDAWDGSEAVAVFDSQFAQDLREAGLSSIVGQATPIAGQFSRSIIYTFNDHLTAAVVTQLMPDDPTKARHLVVEIRRQAFPQAGQPYYADVDAMLTAILQDVSFPSKATSPQVNTNSSP